MSQIFREYQLVSQLTRKSLSSLYLAQSAINDENVVIKAYDSLVLKTEQERENFQQELSFLMQLRHPHILPVINGGLERGHPYIVSGYAAHGSLQDRLTSEPGWRPDFKEAMRIVVQIGKALAYAHEWDILHANLKPENVLFVEGDEVCVSDFRLSTIADLSVPRTRPDTRAAAYMAPERFSGTLSKEVDQYALGCIAYELFTGQPPFMAAAISTWQHKHTSEQPKSLLTYVPDLPEYVSQAVLKALAKEPESRYPDVASFIGALTEAPIVDVSSVLQSDAAFDPEVSTQSTTTTGKIHALGQTETEAMTPEQNVAAEIAEVEEQAQPEVAVSLQKNSYQQTEATAASASPVLNILKGNQAKTWAALAASALIVFGAFLAFSLYSGHSAKGALASTDHTPTVVVSTTMTTTPQNAGSSKNQTNNQASMRNLTPTPSADNSNQNQQQSGSSTGSTGITSTGSNGSTGSTSTGSTGSTGSSGGGSKGGGTGGSKGGGSKPTPTPTPIQQPTPTPTPSPTPKPSPAPIPTIPIFPGP